MTLDNDLDLQALQKIWYQKLKDSGFRDIENAAAEGRPLIMWHSNYFLTHFSPDEFQERAEYFRLAGIFLHTYSFKNHLQKRIWELHSEGQSLRQISSRLKHIKVKMSKDTVQKTIVYLKAMMKDFDLGDDNGAS